MRAWKIIKKLRRFEKLAEKCGNYQAAQIAREQIQEVRRKKSK